MNASGSSALLIDYDEVSSVALPNATFPSWLLTLPDAERYAAIALTRFGPGFAVARIDVDDEIGHGDILFLDLGGGPGPRFPCVVKNDLRISSVLVAGDEDIVSFELDLPVPRFSGEGRELRFLAGETSY